MRNTIDFSPLYQSAIGFDRMASLLDSVARDSKPSFPPYNIELVEENKYRITMAVAGFREDELEITSEQNTLVITGRQESADSEPNFLYQGIAARNFERKFQLAEHVKVNGARLENGLLHVELEREIPETMKPRRIEIDGGRSSERLEQQNAA
ncbi:Hsp20 family protein [Chromatocurvus halotolerans]|uniref:Molecular chaperone IbpA n=1 Tax=Chromatocurvus halotolerans TaxID=1132028 RepID=A0A4R2KTG0_9GAMM|nr:Hsp20 family protein [Chromatocurvus halotolerans]TCO77073.1 molecular chaperone IbpA [Chromatocurvus halotolerans]